MPYTKEELQNVDFYADFVNGLRTKYLEQIKDYAEFDTPFDDGTTLYLFEDILTGMGIESADVTQESLYKTFITPEQQKFSSSVQNKNYPIYDKSELLESTIDRNISELSELKVGKDLPEDIENGMIITNDVASDTRKYLIENNTKRLFEDLGTYYATDYALTKLETYKQDVIDSIVTGDPVE